MGRFHETYNDPLLWACRPSRCCHLTLVSSGGFFIVIATVLNFSYPLISTQFSFHVRCRAENNGRSTDNVRPDHKFRHPCMMILKVERTLNTQKL